MDPNVMITIAFGFEVFLFALAAAFYVAHEVRKGHAGAGADDEAVAERNRRAQSTAHLKIRRPESTSRGLTR
jgi:hypothetical protein